MPTPSKRARKKYQKFVGKKPAYVKITEKTCPNELICIAIPEYLTYYSNKFNGGGNGETQKFIHRLGAKLKLYTNPEGNMLVITGPGLKVTRRGIVG